MGIQCSNNWYENENIDVKISVNNIDKFSYFIAHFYLSTNKRSKLSFCGEGSKN